MRTQGNDNEPKSSPVERLALIKAEVQRMEPKLTDDDEAFHVAVVLLSALEVGQSPMKLAMFTGYSLDWIRTSAARLKANGIWKNGKTHCDSPSKKGSNDSTKTDI